MNCIMSFDINVWLNEIIDKVKAAFGERLLFIGLQGSYNRCEATSDSDIDLVVIIDELTFNDIKIYKKVVAEMPYSNKACGFFAGKKEIQNWSKSDLFQFYYDTKPLYGNLSDIIECPNVEDAKLAIKTGIENIFHMAVHSYVHSNDCKQDLKNLYKLTFFVLQAKYFIRTNRYIPDKTTLYNCLEGTDKQILDICMRRQTIAEMEAVQFETLYKILIGWAVANI